MLKRRKPLSDEELRELYLNQKLTMNEIAARLNVSGSTVRRRLEEIEVASRSRGPKGSRLLPHREITAELLRELYLEQKLSIPQIAELYGWGRETVRLRMIEYGIPIRSFSQSTLVQHGTWDEYHNFSGDPLEKAYLIGFREGDLTARQEYESTGIIRISCGSTRPEQINLIRRLFEPYGHVLVSRKLQLATNGFVQYLIVCSVNQSFDFLLPHVPELPQWIINDDEAFLSFFGGFTDAEGSFHLSKQKGAVTKARFNIKNTNKALLEQCHFKLTALGVNCSSITKVYDAGRQTSKRGVFATKALWEFSVESKDAVLRLIRILGPCLKHEKRRADMHRVRENVEWRNSEEYQQEATRKRVEAVRKTNEAKKQRGN